MKKPFIAVKKKALLAFHTTVARLAKTASTFSGSSSNLKGVVG
ncbi:MAG: hypothetical protein Q8R57_04285 [Bacteroidota bacterium]|nr:hypothetical protein [Bacteroidota bacterium]